MTEVPSRGQVKVGEFCSCVGQQRALEERQPSEHRWPWEAL